MFHVCKNIFLPFAFISCLSPSSWLGSVHLEPIRPVHFTLDLIWIGLVPFLLLYTLVCFIHTHLYLLSPSLLFFIFLLGGGEASVSYYIGQETKGKGVLRSSSCCCFVYAKTYSINPQSVLFLIFFIFLSLLPFTILFGVLSFSFVVITFSFIIYWGTYLVPLVLVLFGG